MMKTITGRLTATKGWVETMDRPHPVHNDRLLAFTHNGVDVFFNRLIHRFVIPASNDDDEERTYDSVQKVKDAIDRQVALRSKVKKPNALNIPVVNQDGTDGVLTGLNIRTGNVIVTSGSARYINRWYYAAPEVVLAMRMTLDLQARVETIDDYIKQAEVEARFYPTNDLDEQAANLTTEYAHLVKRYAAVRKRMAGTWKDFAATLSTVTHKPESKRKRRTR